MTSSPQATMKVPRTQSTGFASNPITAQEAVSVTTYADGTRRAVHNRLDLINRRIIPTSILIGEPESVCAHSMAHSLQAAVDEWSIQVHRQELLF